MDNFLKNDINDVTLGIDEAGRGSVIGPLVIGSVIADNDQINKFEQTGVTDSKLLTPKKRADLAEFVKKTSLKNHYISITPSEINNSIKDENDNLNLLELRTMANLILENIVSYVYIDAISTPFYCTSELKKILQNDASIKFKYESNEQFRIKRQINGKKYHTRIIAQNKADLIYKIVSAASLIAKTQRDSAIREIEREYSLEEGILASGYANPQLYPFLKRYKRQIRKHEFDFIRYEWNWKPLQDVLTKKKEQKKLQL